MTPDEFAARMKAIAEALDTGSPGTPDYRDAETTHIMADALLCEALAQFGYAPGVAIFQQMYKWYA